MEATTSCTVQGCPCMERDGLLAEIEATSELLEIKPSLVDRLASVGAIVAGLSSLAILAKLLS